MTLSSIPEAIAAIREGKFVVVVDDEDRENEGDLIMAAEMVTPQAIAFMVRFTSGIICAPMLADRLDALNLPQMVPRNTESHQTAFTISVDYSIGTTTGISAADRAATLRALVDGNARPEHFARPGHIFPLRYREGGVLRRAGHTEAAVDLARAAGLQPAGVLCELVNDDGTMKRMPELQEFAKEHGLPLIAIRDLIEHRRRTETLIERGLETTVNTRYGVFRAIGYTSRPDGTKPIALVFGEPESGGVPLVRMHVEHVLEDVFGAGGRGDKVDAALRTIAEYGNGVLVYLRSSDGTGLGPAPASTGKATTTQGTEWREHGIGSQILVDLGVREFKLLSSTDLTYKGLEGYGLAIVDRVPLHV